MKFIGLKDALKNDFFPVVVLYGDDEWVKAKAAENIVASLKIEYPEMNVFFFEQPSSLDDVLLACNTLPFSDEQKAVIAEDYFFPAGKKGVDEKAKLSRYSSCADKSCVLVFKTKDVSVFDGTEGITKVDCGRLDSSDITNWIKAYVRKENKTIEFFAADKLCLYCLNDMARISVELEKLCAYSSGEITDADVENMVTRDAEYAVFDLGRAIADKNGKKAFDTYINLKNRGEEVRSLFNVLYNFYRRMYYIRTSAFDVKQLAEYLGVKTGAVNITRDTAGRYKPAALRRALRYFDEADEALKNFADENEVFDKLILKLLAL